MKRIITFAAGATLLTASIGAETIIPVYDHATFYDGYRVTDIPEDAPEEGYIRLYTFLQTVKLTEEQLDAIGENLSMDVTIHALCDNYDRIGSVNLALIPKGTERYEANYDAPNPDYMRVELSRFITPFMNMNKDPKSVPYHYDLDNVSLILRDRELRANYDYWLELMVFGVPYAANNEVAGCSGRNDVFQGSVSFTTDDEGADLVDTNVFVPITLRTPDYRADRGMNNYNETCTDEVGKTVKTWTFEVPQDVEDGIVVLIMSNHGAGTNGEEYNRRNHYVYYDGDEDAIMTFKPGRPTCEPFREFNTQSNGIYGRRPKSDASWQSFSNWCPGDVIDTRIITLGQVKAGEHSIRIEVPEAEFYGSDGYFPVSMYFQGVTEGQLPEVGLGTVFADTSDYESTVRVEGNRLVVGTVDSTPRLVEIYDLEGRLLTYKSDSGSLEIPEGIRGVKMVVVTLSDGRVEGHRVAL